MSKPEKRDPLSTLRDHLVAARDLLVEPTPVDAAHNPVRMHVARALRGVGAHAEALPLYEAALAVQPSHAGALRERVFAETAAGALEAAAEHAAGSPRIG